MNNARIFETGDFATFVQATGSLESINVDESTPESPIADRSGTQSSPSCEIDLSDKSEEFFTPLSAPSLEVFPDISLEERQAIAPVQGLLDKMNWASTQLNDCEQQVLSLEFKRSAVASEWRSRKAELLKTIGYGTIERAKPVFEAYEQQLQLQADLNQAAELYHAAVSELEKIKQVLCYTYQNTSSSSTDELAELLQQSVNAQTKRDTFEHLSLDRTAEFKQAQAKCLELRKSVGLRVVERAWPWFEGFIHSKGRSHECTQHIARLKTEAARLRQEYGECMQQLEAISATVHSIRQQNSPHPD